MRAVRSLTDQIVRPGISGSWKGFIIVSREFSRVSFEIHFRTGQPHHESEHDAQQEAGDDRKIEGAAPAVDGDVAGKAAEAQR